MRRRRRRLRRALLGALLGLLVAVPAAAPQDSPVTPPPGAEDAVVANPDQVVVPRTAVPASTEGGTARKAPAPESPGAAQHAGRPRGRDVGYASAAAQPAGAKVAEARDDCTAKRPPTSPMLAVGGSAGGDTGGSWSGVLFATAAGGLLIAGCAFAARRRRARAARRPATARGPLETVAAVAGLLGVIAGAVVQFVPGAGVHDAPPRQANITVRDVNKRITRGEYARKTGADVRLGREDAREVGNVIWLEVHLESYGGRRPRLQYGSYDLDAGGTLLSGTAREVDLVIREADVQTLFVPIWVGYPKSARFEVQFRLLDGSLVQELAATGTMAGSAYRYECPARI